MSATPAYPSDRRQEIVVQMSDLRDLLVKMYVRQGMFQAEAEIVADRQIEADLRGIQSHGSRATPRYVRAMDSGHIDARGQTLVVQQTPALALLDGGRGMGHVASTKAMQMAIEMAKSAGTGTVAVRNSQHFGAAACYVLMAARAGMIGYCTTSTGRASVAAYGSRAAATANNCFAWAAPARRGAPFCLDMACAVSSWGKVESLGMYGQSIPSGWALDAEGQPTTDAKAAKTLLPAAGPRGYGLAFQCSILAGPLAGGKMPLHKGDNPEAAGSEHFFYCIDVSQMGDFDKFYDELEQTMADIRGLAPATGFDRVALPGQLEWELAERQRIEGVPLHRDHVRVLTELAAQMKIPVPW
ncbi:MAG: Ldh family oxidoreductase [Planctomycetaceae bacterium]